MSSHEMGCRAVLCCMERHTLLLKCFISFIEYIRMNRRGSDSIYKPGMDNILLFLLKTTLNFHVKYQSLGTLSLHMNWDAVLHGETSIVA